MFNTNGINVGKLKELLQDVNDDLYIKNIIQLSCNNEHHFELLLDNGERVKVL